MLQIYEEKMILKGNKTTKYIEYKLKNTVTTAVVVSPFVYLNYSVLIHPQNVDHQNSSIKTF